MKVKEVSGFSETLKTLFAYLTENHQKAIMHTSGALPEILAQISELEIFSTDHRINEKTIFHPDDSNYYFNLERLPKIELYYLFGSKENHNYILFEEWDDKSTLILHVEGAGVPLPFVDTEDSMSIEDWRKYLYRDFGFQKTWIEVEV